MFLKEEMATQSEAVGQVPATGRDSNFKKIAIIGLLCLAIAGAGMAAFYFLRPPDSATGKLKMSLTAKQGDLNGVEKGTAFILTSNKKLSPKEIEKNVAFEPQIKFDIKEKKPLLSLLASKVLAASQQTFNNEYELTPKEGLIEGAVYKVRTATSTDLQLDHDYSWAFKVKEEFGIKNLLPADQSTGAPINTGIEITMNRLDIGKGIEKYFAIEPKVEGRLEVGLNKITFIPKGDLKEKTLYEVTIKKGYRAGEKNEELLEDKKFSFETAAAEAASALPSLYWNSDYSEMTPDKEGFLEASGDATTSEARVLKYASTDDFLKDYYKYRGRQFDWSAFNQEQFAPSAQAREVAKFAPQLLKQNEGENYGLIKMPKKLESGFYVTSLTVGSVTNYAFIRVSPLAYYYTVVNGDGLVWAYDFANKKPYADISILQINKDGSQKPLGKTNNNGLLKFDSSSEKDDNPNISLIFKGEGLVETAVPDAGRIFAVKKNYFQGYLNTDRYAYRLTDKVRFWGVVKGRSFDLRQKKVQVSLDGYLIEKEVTVSPFDTIEGELDFTGMRSGAHSLEVSYNDETITQSGIEIFSFEKPLYKIEVAADKNFSVTGEPVRAKVKVSFFDGTPVKGMDLSYAINWKENKEGAIKTDDNGEAILDYTPEYYFEEKSDQYSDYWTSYPMSLRFTVRPQLGEEGEIWGETYVNVYGPKLYIQSETENKDKTIAFKTKVNGLNFATTSEDGIIGQPAVGRQVSATVIRYYYKEIPAGEIYDPIEKRKVKIFTYELQKETVKEAQGTTDAKGEWSIEVDKNIVKDNGYLKAIFTAADDSGKKVKSSSQSYDYSPNSSVSLDLTNADIEKDGMISYKVGDKVHLRATVTGNAKPIDNRTLIIKFQEGLRGTDLIEGGNFTDNFSDNYPPSMTYQAVRMMPSGFLESYPVTASYDEEVKKLKIDIATDKEKYRPRENINLDINIKDKDGKGVESVANVAAVDEALFNITPWGYGGDILGTLYAEIYSYPNSLSTRYVTDFKNGAEKGGCFAAGTKVAMADGSHKNIEDIRVGDEIRTLENESSPIKVTSVVQGVSSHEVGGYLLINGRLKATPEHKMFISGAWKMAAAARVGDYLRNEQGANEEINDIKYIRNRGVKVYNIIVGRYHTYFADGYYVHNAEKGGGGDTRNFFEDTPLYKQFESDGSGRIKASFKAPDNLTSWRVSVNAYSQKSFSAGNQDKLVSVGLPLFVDASVAKKYLTGDSPEIKIRAFGSDYQKGKPTEFSVTSDSLKINFSTTTSASEISLSLGKLPQGKHRLVASVKQGELKDSLEKPFEVLDNYFKTLKSNSQAVTQGQANIAGNKGGFTDLLFVDEGKGKFFNKLLELTWQASVRSDIQSASYLSAKTLDSYFYAGERQFGGDIDLSGYQNRNEDGGALALFPYGQADYGLTAELADAMPEAFDNDYALSVLSEKLDQKGSSTVEELGQTLYGLSALGQPELPFISYLKDNGDTSLETKIYLALALYKAGDGEGAREIYYNELLPQLKVDGDMASLDLGKDKTKNAKVTALLGVLMSKLEQAPENLAKIMTYLENNPPKDDSTALEQAMIITNEIAKTNTADATFDYKTASRNGTADLRKGQTFRLTLSEGELKTLEFSNVTGQPKAISYVEEFADPAQLAKSDKVSIKRSYLVDGKETTELKEGDLVLVRLDPSFAKDAPDNDYQVIDYLPSNLRPVVREYNLDVAPSTECDPIWYPVKTTDEAIYFNIGKWFQSSELCKHRTINFHARVSGKGSFKAQPAAIQSLKNLDLMNVSGEAAITAK